MSEENSVKILFRFYSNILDQQTSETMWAEIIDKEKGYYKLDNIPFYAPLISSDDIVFAEYDESESFLTYRKTIKYSGNSTVHIILLNDSCQINDIRKIFEDLNCISERYNDKYFALEIPFNIDYLPIKNKLEAMENDEILSYAETSLSNKHQY